MKKAEVGIGTLILFIAMILVAAIAASVFIQTASSLQNKALLTGERTKEQVSAGMQALLLYGEDGSTGNNVDQLRLKVKLIPGSSSMRFNETLVEVGVSNDSLDMEYMTGGCAAANTSHFTVQSLIEGNNYREGYLQSGDVSMICMRAPRNMTRDEDLYVRVIPKYAQPLIIESTLPDVITTTRVFIFP